MNCVLFAKMDQVFSKENKTLKKYWKSGKKYWKSQGKVREFCLSGKVGTLSALCQLKMGNQSYHKGQVRWYGVNICVYNFVNVFRGNGYSVGNEFSKKNQ